MSVGPEVTGEANLGREARPHVVHVWVCAAGAVEVAQAMHVARLFWASVVRLLSAARALVVSLLCQVERFCASYSHVLRLMFMSLRDTLRQSLKHFFCPQLSTCPRAVLHTLLFHQSAVRHSDNITSPSDLALL